MVNNNNIWEVNGTVLGQAYGLLGAFFNLFILVAAKVDFMVLRRFPTAQSLVYHFGPRCYTIQPTVTEKTLKSYCILHLKTFLCTPYGSTPHYKYEKGLSE